jgi:cyclic beta-1,2-glucan synthetase
MPDDAALLARIRAGVEMLNAEIPGRIPHLLLPLPPAAPLEPGGRPVDGIRTQTRETHGVQLAPARRLRGCFSEISGETGILPAIKYVITLDTDTQLPRDSARRLVGTMAHPLNRPRFDPPAVS